MIRILLVESDSDRSVLIKTLKPTISISTIVVSGHASELGYQRKGKEHKALYACNGISTIMFGALNAINKICPTDLLAESGDNYIKIVVINLTITTTLLINLIIIQIQTVIKKLPNAIEMIIIPSNKDDVNLDFS